MADSVAGQSGLPTYGLPIVTPQPLATPGPAADTRVSVTDLYPSQRNQVLVNDSPAPSAPAPLQFAPSLGTVTPVNLELLRQAIAEAAADREGQPIATKPPPPFPPFLAPGKEELPEAQSWEDPYEPKTPSNEEQPQAYASSVVDQPQVLVPPRLPHGGSYVFVKPGSPFTLGQGLISFEGNAANTEAAELLSGRTLGALGLIDVIASVSYQDDFDQLSDEELRAIFAILMAYLRKEIRELEETEKNKGKLEEGERIRLKALEAQLQNLETFYPTTSSGRGPAIVALRGVVAIVNFLTAAGAIGGVLDLAADLLLDLMKGEILGLVDAELVLAKVAQLVKRFSRMKDLGKSAGIIAKLAKRLKELAEKIKKDKEMLEKLKDAKEKIELLEKLHKEYERLEKELEDLIEKAKKGEEKKPPPPIKD